MKPIAVKDRLPTEEGTYLCIRFGMPYKPEPIDFFIDEAEGECGWIDSLGDMKGGGGGVSPYNLLDNKDKYWRRMYGRVLFWFAPPENHMNHYDFMAYCDADMSSQGIKRHEKDGKWDRIGHKVDYSYKGDNNG